jgi:hypothetical protein
MAVRDGPGRGLASQLIRSMDWSAFELTASTSSTRVRDKVGVRKVDCCAEAVLLEVADRTLDVCRRGVPRLVVDSLGEVGLAESVRARLDDRDRDNVSWGRTVCVDRGDEVLGKVEPVLLSGDAGL